MITARLLFFLREEAPQYGTLPQYGKEVRGDLRFGNPVSRAMEVLERSTRMVVRAGTDSAFRTRLSTVYQFGGKLDGRAARTLPLKTAVAAVWEW